MSDWRRGPGGCRLHCETHGAKSRRSLRAVCWLEALTNSRGRNDRRDHEQSHEFIAAATPAGQSAAEPAAPCREVRVAASRSGQASYLYAAGDTHSSGTPAAFLAAEASDLVQDQTRPSSGSGAGPSWSYLSQGVASRLRTGIRTWVTDAQIKQLKGVDRIAKPTDLLPNPWPPPGGGPKPDHTRASVPRVGWTLVISIAGQPGNGLTLG